jgi:hypothetical protein
MRKPAAHALRVFLASATLYGALIAGSLAAPGIAVACRCVEPRPLADYGKDADHVVLAGTIGMVDAQGRAPFQVQRVYHGDGVAAALPIQGGDELMCGVRLVSNDRVILVGSIQQGVLHASGCAPFASLASPGGQRLAAEADVAFGAFGIPPPGGAPLPIADTGPAADTALLLAAGGLAIGTALLFGAVTLVARRRRPAG